MSIIAQDAPVSSDDCDCDGTDVSWMCPEHGIHGQKEVKLSETKIKDGGQAFPSREPFLFISSQLCYECLPKVEHMSVQGAGMTLLDWFAGQALAGMHARDSFDEGLATPAQRAKIAYIDAAAILAEREKIS